MDAATITSIKPVFVFDVTRTREQAHRAAA
jgi:hypothetical protein